MNHLVLRSGLIDGEIVCCDERGLAVFQARYRSGRSPDWLKFKNPAAPAVIREAEED